MRGKFSVRPHAPLTTLAPAEASALIQLEASHIYTEILSPLFLPTAAYC